MLWEFDRMEKCFDYTSQPEWEKYIRQAAVDDSFFVSYSAVNAIEKYGNEAHLELLADILKREDNAPVYGQRANLKNTDAAAGDNMVEAVEFPKGTTDYEKAAWQRRGKLKQAACLAIGAIYRRRKPLKEHTELINYLHKYAVDQGEDYSVRAAAAKTLRDVGRKESLDVLKTAAKDPEFCTALEAKKSIGVLEGGKSVPQETYAPFERNDNLNIIPFYIDNIEALRNKIKKSDNEYIKRLWCGISTKSENGGYPWFEPFTAIITGEKKDIEQACGSIRAYVNSLENLRYNPGVHFHSWCFAFPHARWCLYFQWMYTMGAFSEEDAHIIAAKLVSHQFMYYYSCYRVKPEPEIVDNQTLSLAISNALVGYIFGNSPFDSAIAQLMFEKSIKRVEFILKKMGDEDYSGEGSTYMNHVIASCIPLGVELLERVYKEDYFKKCKNISEMMAREIMPDGLALPWDHYGYILPTLQCLAYNARRIDAGKYTQLLEEYTDYSFSIITGWGFDDLVWTLIWYEECEYKKEEKKAFGTWFIPDTAGCIVSKDMQLALVQMFDRAKESQISRYHCNPNALILSAFGTPLLTEGYPSEQCNRFKYEETSKTFGFMSIEPITVNDGYGCAGAHSVILVDNYEAMRPVDESEQLGEVRFEEENNALYSDVTPIYKQNFKDAVLVSRYSHMYYDRFWLIEDTVIFEQEHDFTMRLITRPDVHCEDGIIYIRTPEGVELNMIELNGGGKTTIETVDGYPNTLDKRSVIIDNTKRGKSVSYKHLLIPHDCKLPIEDISNGWHIIPDRKKEFSYEEAYNSVKTSNIIAPIEAPIYFFRKELISKSFWYYKRIKNPGGKCLIKLPRNLHNAGIWINKKKYETGERGLLPVYIRIDEQLSNELEILIYMEVGISQYRDPYNGGGFFGKAVIYRECPHEKIKFLEDEDNITITAYGKTYRIGKD